MDIGSTQSWQSKNKYGTNVSPCKILAAIWKKSVSLSGEQTIVFVLL